MYVIAFFGFLLALFSVLMIIYPAYFADGIVKFSEKPYFHPFEVISRFVFGLGFVIFASETLYPRLIAAIGILLIAVGIGLLFTPPSKHRQFAVWSAAAFRNKFRLFGFFSLPFACFLIYAAFKS